MSGNRRVLHHDFHWTCIRGFSAVFDKYIETDKAKHEVIYKIILLFILITTTGLALKYHLLSTLMVLLAFMFIDKIKMFLKE